MKRFIYILAFVLILHSTATAREVSAKDRAYISNVLRAIKENDVEWIAKEFVYPVVIKAGNEENEFATSQTFIPELRIHLTQTVREEILEKSKEPLFANWRGIMVGDGHLWIEQIKENETQPLEYRILAIGLFAFQADSEIEPAGDISSAHPQSSATVKPENYEEGIIHTPLNATSKEVTEDLYYYEKYKDAPVKVGPLTGSTFIFLVGIDDEKRILFFSKESEPTPDDPVFELRY